MLSIANTDNKHGRFDSTKFSEGFPENLVLSNRCAAVLSIANTENKQGRFDSTNFSGGFSVINLVLSNRCAAVLSIASTDNKHGRFDSTKFCEGFSFRKFDAIEPLRCCVIHGGSKAPKFLKGCLSENLVLLNRCAAVLSIENAGNKQGRFDSTKFSEGFPF